MCMGILGAGDYSPAGTGGKQLHSPGRGYLPRSRFGDTAGAADSTRPRVVDGGFELRDGRKVGKYKIERVTAVAHAQWYAERLLNQKSRAKSDVPHMIN